MARASKIDQSAHRDEYRDLMLQGWSSYALERYAWEVHKEQIPSRAFRRYVQTKLSSHPEYKKRKSSLQVAVEVVTNRPVPELPDVLMALATILEMGLSRATIYWQRELAALGRRT